MDPAGAANAPLSWFTAKKYGGKTALTQKIYTDTHHKQTVVRRSAAHRPM